MTSQISQNNLWGFIDEERVADGVSKADLQEYYEEAQARGGKLVCCNYCDRLLVVGTGDGSAVLHDGQPEGESHAQSADAEVVDG